MSTSTIDTSEIVEVAPSLRDPVSITINRLILFSRETDPNGKRFFTAGRDVRGPPLISTFSAVAE